MPHTTTHDLVHVECISWCSKQEHIELVAIAEEMVLVPGSRTYLDPPEYAPARVKIEVSLDYLPEGLDYANMDEEELQDVLNRHVNLDAFEWQVMIGEQ